jgi:hypothetical protein
MKKLNISALTPDTIKEIQALMGSELTHLVAIDVNNRPVFFSEEDLQAYPEQQIDANQLRAEATATRMCKVLIGGVWVYYPC